MTVVLILDFLFITLSRAMCTHPVEIYLPSVWEGTALHFDQRKTPICHDNTVTCHSGMPALSRACWHSALEWVELLCRALTAHLFIAAHFLHHKTSSSFHQLAWVMASDCENSQVDRGIKLLCNFTTLNIIWFIPLHPCPFSPSLACSLTSVCWYWFSDNIWFTAVGRAIGGALRACHSW